MFGSKIGLDSEVQRLDVEKNFDMFQVGTSNIHPQFVRVVVSAFGYGIVCF